MRSCIHCGADLSPIERDTRGDVCMSCWAKCADDPEAKLATFSDGQISREAQRRGLLKNPLPEGVNGVQKGLEGLDPALTPDRVSETF
jgi:hypothetical protein